MFLKWKILNNDYPVAIFTVFVFTLSVNLSTTNKLKIKASKWHSTGSIKWVIQNSNRRAEIKSCHQYSTQVIQYRKNKLTKTQRIWLGDKNRPLKPKCKKAMKCSVSVMRLSERWYMADEIWKCVKSHAWSVKWWIENKRWIDQTNLENEWRW